MLESRFTVALGARLVSVGAASLTLCQICAQAQQAGSNGGPVGQVQTSGSANRERLVIEPSMTLSYDSNILRRDSTIAGGDTDNVRVTPSLTVGYNREVGRTALSLGAALGYDFNSRFRYLNRQRLTLRAGVVLPVGALCPISLSASHQEAQYDLADTEDSVASVLTINEFSTNIRCTRAGITPTLGGSYRDTRNSTNPLGDNNYREAHFGARLNVPSIGALTINGQLGKIARPEFERVTGTEDSTDIKRIYLAFERAVAPRFRFSSTIGFVDATPARSTVPSFSGLSYSAEAGYLFTPRLRLTLNGSRDVETSSGLTASYMIRSQLRATANIDVLNRTSIIVAGSYVKRNLKKEAGNLSRFGSDEAKTVSVNISRDIGRRLRLGLSSSYISRDADVDLFDFDSTNVALTFSSRF
jgi:hypothetical protein